MNPATLTVPAAAASPLVLSDRLLTLARAADHAGCRATAVTLLGLAHAVLDETPGCELDLAVAA